MEKEVEINGETRFICVICGLGVFPSPISIDKGVLHITIKGSPPPFPINLHHLSLAPLAWSLRTLHAHQVSCRLFLQFVPIQPELQDSNPELNVLPHSLLRPVFQPNSTGISGGKQMLTVTARSYWLQNSFQIGSIPHLPISNQNFWEHARIQMPKVPNVAFQKTQRRIYQEFSILSDQIKQLIDHLKKFLDFWPRKIFINLS